MADMLVQMLVLPAIAVDNRTVGFRASWTQTRNNSLRISLVIGVTIMPAIVAAFPLLYFTPATALQAALRGGAISVLTGLTGLVGVGAPSFA